MELTLPHLAGITATLSVIMIIGIYSGRNVRTPADFSVSGRRAGPFLVMGTILGTLIGGASTIGTAQMAYLYGFSAWWFTLGGGLGCLIIALFLAKPMRRATSFETVSGFISHSYGSTPGLLVTAFICLGMFLNIVPQMFSSMALLSAMFPLGLATAASLTALLVVLYVVFGGAWGTGMMGLTKIILTCLGMITAGLTALLLSGGFPGLAATFPRYPWFSLFGRGVNTDLASGISLIVGVISSQIYFQAILGGRSLAAARGGVFLSSLLGPTIGFGGVLVGLYMRSTYPDINPAQALPLFVINHLPPIVAGIILVTLLFVTLGTGAGLALGISTMINRDVYMRIWPEADDRQILRVFRGLIVLIMILALITVLATGGDTLILNWGYISLSVRGAAVCFPLLAVLVFKGKIPGKTVTAAILLGPGVVAAGLITGLPFGIHPLFPGLGVSLAALAAGFFYSKAKHETD